MMTENFALEDILFGEDYTDEEKDEIISEAMTEIMELKINVNRTICIRGCRIAQRNPRIVCAYSALISRNARKKNKSL